MRPMRAGLCGVVLVILLGHGMIAAQPPSKVGVILSLTGPLALDGSRALEAIRGMWGRRRASDLVIVDDQTRIERAVQAVHQMLEQDRVRVIIGPMTVSATAALVPTLASARIPMVSLATASREQISELRERGRGWTVFFAPVATRQIDAAGDILREAGTTRIGLAYFNATSAGWAEELGLQLRRKLLRPPDTFRAPVGTRDEAEAFTRQARGGRTAVVGVVSEPAAQVLVEQLRQAQVSGPVIIFSPPRIDVKAQRAMRLVMDALDSGAVQDDSVLRSILTSIGKKEEGYDPALQAVPMEWDATVYASDMRGLAGLQPRPGALLSCACNSEDRKVSRILTCPASYKCSPLAQRDSCSVECAGPGR